MRARDSVVDLAVVEARVLAELLGLAEVKEPVPETVLELMRTRVV